MKQKIKLYHSSLALVSLTALLGLSSQSARAAEFARIISTTAYTQSIPIQSSQCATNYSDYNGNYNRYGQYSSNYYGSGQNGAGALIGAIAGGIIGNQIGNGSGQVAATIIGSGVGAAVGSNLENSGYNNYYQYNCVPQTNYESRTLYNVNYEYRGQIYTTQMPWAPTSSYIDIEQLNPVPTRAYVASTPVYVPAPVYYDYQYRNNYNYVRPYPRAAININFDNRWAPRHYERTNRVERGSSHDWQRHYRH